MLSKRLKAISEFIPKESSVIDVGADHGLLDIYLTLEKNCKCLATDISPKALEKAKENFISKGVDIQTMVTDGLNGINLKNEYIVISGMGTKTILNIVPNNLSNDLIISSHKDLEILRKKMQKKGYYIYNEKAIFDKRYYVIMHFKKGKKKTNCYVSPYLKNNKEYMNYLLLKYEKIFYNTKNRIKKIKVYFIIRNIKKSL